MLTWNGYIIYIDLILYKRIQERFLREFIKVLSPNGRFLILLRRIRILVLFLLTESYGFSLRESKRNHSQAFHCTYDSNKFLIDFLYDGDFTFWICNIFCNSCLFSFISISFLCDVQYSPVFLQSLQLRYFV